MKIKTIIGFCKKKKRIMLFNGTNNVEWLGDGSAIYPLFKLPYMTEEHIFAFMEIPEEKQSDYIFEWGDETQELSFVDDIIEESMVEKEKIIISYQGMDLQPIRTKQGLMFIDSKYLSPLVDYFSMLELYERKGNIGTYFVAKNGLTLVAIIMPVNIICEDFVSQMEDLTQQCKVALLNDKAK